MSQASPTPGKTLLSPSDHTLILIDHQSQMVFATKSIDAIELRNNSALVANSARVFGVATILTTVAEKSFSGPIFSEIKDALPEVKAIDRTTMNTWEDERSARQRVRKEASRARGSLDERMHRRSGAFGGRPGVRRVRDCRRLWRCFQ